MGNRSRLVIWDSILAGEGQSIDLLKELPFNATLLQWSFRINTTPSSLGSLTIVKRSVHGPGCDILIIATDPASWDYTQKICNEQWQFLRGDKVEVKYSNPNDLGVGIELIFTEAN